jgi:DNA polymerase-3 subunit delta'
VIIGHATIRKYFENAAKNGILHHAYCFAGPGGVGKRTVARSIAAALLKTTPERLEIHPDFQYLERTVDEKTGKLHKDINVSQARQLRERLQSRAWLGGYRIVIIDEAELLNTEASNALLKTLEEPAEKSIIFLLTENEDSLLPTIRSRTQLFTFLLVGDSEIQEFLIATGVTADRARDITLIAAGRPGLATELAHDEGQFTEWVDETKRWSDLLGQPLYKKLATIENIFGDKNDGVRGRARVSAVLDIWIRLWQETLLMQTSGVSGLSHLVPALEQHSLRSGAEVVVLIDRLREAQNLLDRNIQPRLVVEQAIFDF